MDILQGELIMVKCQYCFTVSEVVRGKVIFPGLSKVANKKFNYCDDCQAWCDFDSCVLADRHLRSMHSNVYREIQKIASHKDLSYGHVIEWVSSNVGIGNKAVNEMSLCDCETVMASFQDSAAITKLLLQSADEKSEDLWDKLEAEQPPLSRAERSRLARLARTGAKIEYVEEGSPEYDEIDDFWDKDWDN